MISYSKSFFGLNLLVRAHGSAVYKSIFPGAVSVGILLLFDLVWHKNSSNSNNNNNNNDDDNFDQPYTISIFVSTVSLLVVFRANYAYQRYWEAVGSVYGAMSKWLDATVHTSNCHMQSYMYDGIRPISLTSCDLDHGFTDMDRSMWDDDDGHDNENSGKGKKKRDIAYGNISLSAGVEKKKRFAQDSDGRWGALFDDKKRFDNSSYNCGGGGGFNNYDDGKVEMTPPLFLQELAHLSSLCAAVAFCTLRNDNEDVDVPLGTYRPGSSWPEADPDHIPSSSGYHKKSFTSSVKYYLGIYPTATERTNRNASRPLPVLGGVSPAEIKALGYARGPYAKFTLAWSWLSEFIIREYTAGSLGGIGYPMISRVFQFLSDGTIQYNHARKVAYIPFPFPHAQLTTFFVTITAIVAIPLLTDQYVEQAWLGATLTFLSVTCLVGLHEVARELENPYRNVPNDIPLVTLMAEYNESLSVMYAGFHPDHRRAVYRRNAGECKSNGEVNGEGRLMGRTVQNGIGCRSALSLGIGGIRPVPQSPVHSSVIPTPSSIPVPSYLAVRGTSRMTTVEAMADLRKVVEQQAVEIERLKMSIITGGETTVDQPVDGGRREVILSDRDSR